MRIISGSLRRRSISVPDGAVVRPTTDRVREAIFNWLASRYEFDGLHVLDLFAGAGGLGFEALSRGAGLATFVERSSAVVQHLRQTAESFDVTAESQVVRADVQTWLENPGVPDYDLILADPPYDYQDLDLLVEAALPHLSRIGSMVLEHAKPRAFNEHPYFVEERRYGRSLVAYFSMPDEGES